jgi:hypothetical protein
MQLSIRTGIFDAKRLAETPVSIEGTDFGTIMEDDKVMSNMGTYTVRTE